MGECIEVHRDHLTCQEVKKICDDLQRGVVQAVTLREVSLTDKDFKSLLKHVASAQHVRHLSLSVGMVTDGYRIQLLALCVQKNAGLTGLFLHGNSLGDVGINALHPPLRAHSAITVMDVGDCGVGDDGLELLCTLLPGTSSTPGLRELVLSCNPAITDRGWAKLSVSLMQGTGLRVLYVDYNDLLDVSASCLLMAIVNCRHMDTLDMECTGVTEATGQLLLNLLDQYPAMSLKSVNLTENDISTCTMEAITMRLPEADEGGTMLDFNSDEEHSLATSEPPLDNSQLFDECSEVSDEVFKVHPVTVAVVEDTQGTAVKSDVIESKTDVEDRGKTVKSKPKHKGNTKTGVSLADRIKGTRPSSAVTLTQPATNDTTLRSNSTGDTLQNRPADSMKPDYEAEEQSNSITIVSTDTNTGDASGQLNSDEGSTDQAKKEHKFLVPETPAVIALHKYREGLRGQDDEHFQPIKSQKELRPRSAPTKKPLSKQQTWLLNKELMSATKTPNQKQPTKINKQELQVIDSRRRLSCGSVLLSTNGNKHLSTSSKSLRTFTRAHSLQTPEPKSENSSGPGSPDENIRRRLSGANIQPAGFSDNVPTTSGGSNSTLGDLHLEEIT